MRTWPRQTIQEVADGIVAIVHGHGEVGVSNATFVIDGQQAFVVDTMTFPEMTMGMQREIARRGARVETVLNTHHHIDHMGGNKVFADAHILAHPESVRAVQKLGLPAPIYDRLMPQFRGQFTDLELVIPAPELDTVVPRGGVLYSFTPAHTPADTAVWFPESRVLIAGDISFIGVTPLSVNGHISGWIEALDALIALQPAVVIPGHGPVGTVQDLMVLRGYLTAIHRLGRRAVEEKMSLQEARTLLDAGPVAEWIEAERHIINLERAIQEIRGDISRTDLSTMPGSARKP